MAVATSPSPADDAIRVMVVDDSLVIRGMISRMIDETDDLSVVATAGDGERALSALRRAPVDVVVLDIEMPKMDGIEALPKILEQCPGVQVVMASTLTLRNAEISLRAMQLGAADYVTKPGSSGELRSADAFKQELIGKVRALGKVARRRSGSRAPAAAPPRMPKLMMVPAPRGRYLRASGA
jgi:two-component system chemotaxis response regulator CheB